MRGRTWSYPIGGFHDHMRRLSVRIASAVSTWGGQTEPFAEFQACRCVMSHLEPRCALEQGNGQGGESSTA